MRVDASETIRFSLTIEYDGAGFHGWQVQPDQRTVQGVLQDTLSRLGDQPCVVVGSGRTDTGVHATGQVAAVDMPSSWTVADLARSLAATLPEDVRVRAVHAARPDFHPRYDALARTYQYRVGTDADAASPFQRRWCWPLGETLDENLLAAAASELPGRHSFRAFAKSGQPERGEECTVHEATWTTWAHGPCFTIRADRYLHHMVRYLVGTMVDVARARRPLRDVRGLLENDPELTTSPPAPPQGLFLSRVEYPDTVLLATDPTPSQTRSPATA